MDIADAVERTGNQLQGQVTRTRADLEDGLAQVRADHVGHPLGETWSAIEAAENLTARLVAQIDMIGESKMNDRADAANSVLPADLFAFLITAASIANGHFKNSRGALGQLDGDLGLEAETGADQRDALQQVRPNHLVAGFRSEEHTSE